MSWGAVAVGAGSAVLGYMGQQQVAGAQSAANRRNVALSREQLEEQKRQFDIQQLEDERRYGQQFGDLSQSRRDYAQQQLGGYGQAGQAATQQMQALLGLGTPEQQAAAQGAIQESPGQKFIRERAQKSLLRNQAAIGGLGGGNVRSELVEQGAGFAAQDLENQFRRLQGLSGQGLSAGQTMVGRDIGVLGGGAPVGGGGQDPTTRPMGRPAAGATLDALGGQSLNRVSPSGYEGTLTGRTKTYSGERQKAREDVTEQFKSDIDKRVAESYRKQAERAAKDRQLKVQFGNFA